MSLSDLKDAPRPSKRREQCRTADWIDTLDNAKREGLDYALSARFPVTSVYDEALKDGYSYNYDAFLKHVNGRCSCVSR